METLDWVVVVGVGVAAAKHRGDLVVLSLCQWLCLWLRQQLCLSLRRLLRQWQHQSLLPQLACLSAVLALLAAADM